MSAFGGGAGFEVPKGNPGALRGAAAVFAATAETLDSQASALDGSAVTVTLADWQGAASQQFSAAGGELSAAMRDGSAAARDAAAACKHHASLLQEAKHKARTALRDAEHAIDVGVKAEQRLADAKDAAAAAQGRAAAARGSAATARSGGPAGEATAQSYDADERQASGEYSTAMTAAGGAQRVIDDAKSDLTDARKRGNDANDDAEKAGKHAASALEHAAGGAKPPELAIAPAVPVTVRSEPNPLLAVAGSPFRNPFGITPGDIRKQQIAAAEERRKAAEEKQQGGFDDAFGGMLAPWLGTDFGIGDKRTGAYKGNKAWNEALTFVPTPAGARSQLERRLGKQAIKEGAERGGAQALKHADDVGRERRFWTRTHHFENTKVYQRDDLIDVARVDERGRTNADRM